MQHNDMHKGTEFFALTKESNEKELKLYFNAVLKLAESDNEFPINLNEVYPLVYERKDNAVKALKENFLEGVDYQLLRQKAEQVSGAKWVDTYLITVSCMEFFIARKVRAVFEVYRKVFHKTTEIAKAVHTPSSPVYSLEDKMKAIELSCKMLRSNKATKARMINSVIAPMGLPTFDYIITSVKTEVGSNKNDYYISLSCMEFFIARKVRAVFEVYRKVFHKTTEIAKAVHTPSSPVYSLEDKMKAIELSCKMLRSNKATKARMINSVIAPMGLPTFDYIESKGQKRAAKDLLPNGISSIKFNKALEKLGMIEYMERTSRSKGVEKYPVITGEGLKFGENEESPEHPGKTQPRWYVDKFSELIKLTGLTSDSSLFNEN